ncbi:RNA polymerase sigma-70 factor (ECF subfamily) [Saccharopolyspora erythraea NRRL 2338]|uniref:RNA polymerase ECF-subfamily sigma factor n=2 Tax=Saccharopolyspora erythraea TaxID=1836 RepID=A4FNE7_SACEN|nr:RNA polymerase sigma factor [Saccharopolyspora erythraea]EQD87120.1 RNA polymerase sigma70 factor [Saccharopolyspora erythraea D]PFG99210.1 RNA polymerase sigma-70 factor (ECF subfamily) [Saccharopolyspora erythraea NRRL 2338]QRK89158.1 RNA polymerase sigma factor [Saccharopolyspora erythraea]CAM05572.1 RNA polymerase ECF-subfamily sigma factor [Saccharopolyspora erythraea NRRL 2338]
MALDEDRPSLTTGDPTATFGRLFDEYAAPLHRYLARRTDESVADDLVAETFLAALRHRASYDPERANVRSWLYGIATNLLRKHLRTELRGLRATARMVRASEVSTAGHESRVAEAVDAHSSVNDLAAALAELSPADRDTLLLTAWGGLDSTEVADVLGIPVGTVRSRIHRVRRQLRKNAPGAASRQTTEDIDEEANRHA